MGKQVQREILKKMFAWEVVLVSIGPFSVHERGCTLERGVWWKELYEARSTSR